MAKRVLVLLAAALLALACLGAGCGESVEETVVVDRDPSDAVEQPSEVDGGEVGRDVILMNGRSVMEGWLSTWGYDWEGPIEKEGYSFEYGPLDSDLSAIADSFEHNISSLPEGSIAFFKFCFADFYGDNLSQLEAIIDEVIGAAEDKDIRLIIGNALPMSREAAPEGVLSEYDSYNSYLEEKASESPQVVVFDFYDVLTDEDGFLRSEYDVGDCHLNESAYRELDAGFFPLLDEVAGGGP